MKDFQINSIIIIIVLTVYLYHKGRFKKYSDEKSKRKSIKNTSKMMIGIFSLFWLFIIITSLIRYNENIIVNLIISTGLTSGLLYVFYRKVKKKALKFYSTKDIIKIGILITFILTNYSAITNKIRFISRGDAISISDIEIGDILFLHVGLADSLLPGYWSHIGIVSEKTDGAVNVIEATASGIHSLSLKQFIGTGRISVAKAKSITPEARKTIVKFAKEKIGLPYNFYLIDKQIHRNKYYCSELIWASYQQVGIDIDKNPGFFIRYFNAVAPQEIFGDDDLIIYHINKTLKNAIIDNN